MNKKTHALGITELVLRDAHQSLLATRMRIDDMLPITEKLDQVGFWSIESWGGATFDACLRFLGEDPWDRIRELKKAMPNTPQQMLFRGQNILGYRHYADDVVEKFVERAAKNGVDIFRIFDALNDLRNLETSVRSVIKQGKHAQGTISYTVSPVHTVELWIDLSKRIEDMGAHSLCIKDMAGLLQPYTAFKLVSQLKNALAIPIHIQCHATTGLSSATYLKCIEAGIDNVDTAISSMSMTYGHSPTETIVSILETTDRATGLNMSLLEEIATYFRKVRKKYKQFEGSLKGVDSRILVSQVPGGMLTNLENQLKEQNAENKIDEVLDEIPKVREDLGFIPLVTPTSQIVGTQAVLNVLSGKYKKLTKETEGILKGEYGKTPMPVNTELQKRVLSGKAPINQRPADILKPELYSLTEKLKKSAKENSFSLSKNIEDDVLSYALFPQISEYFFKNKNDIAAFEAEPRESKSVETRKKESHNNVAKYEVSVDGEKFEVEITESSGEKVGSVSQRKRDDLIEIPAPLAGNVSGVNAKIGQKVSPGEILITMEAMKMETEIVSPEHGTVTDILVSTGEKVQLGDPLVNICK